METIMIMKELETRGCFRVSEASFYSDQCAAMFTLAGGPMAQASYMASRFENKLREKAKTLIEQGLDIDTIEFELKNTMY